MRAALDWVIGRLAMVLARAFYRSIEVVGTERVPSGRPVLVVANHFNGMVDAVVVTATLRRLPRIVAKSSRRKSTNAALCLRDQKPAWSCPL